MADDHQTQEQGKKEEKSGLEALANEASDYGKVVVGTISVAGAAAHLWANSSLAAALTSVPSFPLGHFIETKIARNPKDVESDFGTYAKEPWTAFALAPAALAGFKAVNAAPKALGLDGMVTNILEYSAPTSSLVVGGLTFGVLAPALIAAYFPLKHLFDKGTFKGMGEDFKKHYLKGLARTTPLNLISSLAAMDAYSGYTWTSYLTSGVAAFLAPYLAVPAMALLGLGVLGVGYRLALSKHDLNYWKLLNPVNWTPLPEIVSGVMSVSYKGVKAFFTGLYDLGQQFSFRGSQGQARAVPRPAH